MNDRSRSGQALDLTERGLCATCRRAQVITSSRGSRFVLCRMSAVDVRYPKYPPLPVLRCDAFDPRES
jgi:hypothetical protein